MCPSVKSYVKKLAHAAQHPPSPTVMYYRNQGKGENGACWGRTIEGRRVRLGAARVVDSEYIEPKQGTTMLQANQERRENRPTYETWSEIGANQANKQGKRTRWRASLGGAKSKH